MSINFTPVFLGSGRCFHTMDWFRSCGKLSDSPPIFVTDNYGGEGFIPLLTKSDRVISLYTIDWLLSTKSSVVGNIWRNFLKFALIPIQIIKLRRILRYLDNPFIFAHSTYYAFLASFSGVKYAATPQGSEVLVRPKKSKLYRMFLKQSVRCSSFTTVDSVAMANELVKLTKVTPEIIQNGIDLFEIDNLSSFDERTLITSLRGLDRNYRITEIIRGRDLSSFHTKLDFCFPFAEQAYEREIKKIIGLTDVLHGRLPREQMYDVFKKSICVLSIPISDSSPRSVYEAIFCGSVVICTHSQYIDNLPICMRNRLVIIDLDNRLWFSEALAAAKIIVVRPYLPSDEAKNIFDQLSSMRKCLNLAASRVSSHPLSSVI